jgi:hypothetical protein
MTAKLAAKGQMNPTSRVVVTASQAGENSQNNALEQTIVFSIRTDLISKETTEEVQYCRNPPLNNRSSRVRETRFKAQNGQEYRH